ncbi:MAG: hypothetical protein ABW173_10670 [Sphingomonas sp.]
MAISDHFRGKALNAIDKKGRVSVPSDFRGVIQTRHRRVIAQDGFDPAEGDEGRHASAGKVVIVTRDRKRPCLIAFENQFVREYADKLSLRHAALAGQEREDAIQRDMEMLGSTFDLAWDVNGRIVLGARLCQRIGVDPAADNGRDNLVFFHGVGETFEIWNADRFIAEVEGRNPDLADDVRDMVEDRAK